MLDSFFLCELVVLIQEVALYFASKINLCIFDKIILCAIEEFVGHICCVGGATA